MNVVTIRGLIRKNKLMKFYKSKEWLSLRGKALDRDNNECQMCKLKGKYKQAENVHHIKEVKTHPELALSLDNLQCLCIRCHNVAHDRLDQEQQKKTKFTNKERW
ncbi:HNH endonuclease [Metabacillus halosaccharovorans]|uniref:HNH endonuclease n=1 Tax=Metabacillus halosaccharovorans TaxID=930124 RepID=UPI00403D6627